MEKLNLNVDMESLNKVLDDLIEKERAAVAENNAVIERRVFKQIEDNKVREAQIEEYKHAKEALNKIAGK